MPESALRFGRFEFQPARRMLAVDGEPAVLGARALDILAVLIERRDRVVSKAELLDAVWPGLVVEENNLAVHISALRKVMGNAAIATVPGRGYRFVAAVTEEPGAADRATPPAETAGAPRRLTNIPPLVNPIIGRDRETHDLQRLLGDQRLVTLVGAGGIGKSTLAQSVAAALASGWRDGAWWVELASLSDGALVAQAVARAMGIPVPARGETVEHLCADLANREALLVLDNCEHLLDEVARLVESIIHAAPKVQVLATSQEPLRVIGEQQYRLEPLAVPSSAQAATARSFGAIALLVARLRSADPRFELSDAEVPVAIDLCRQLDGMPLAIELAAARVPVMGLRGVHDRLHERFRILTAGSRTAMRRHQTLRAALEWSHGLLNDFQKAVFRRLGVFSGGTSMELAQAVCADPGMDQWQVLESLGALVEKSLVVADLQASARYRLLESARSFALEQLAAAGETDAMLERHSRSMLEFLRDIDGKNLDGEMRTDQYAALLLPELDNLRAAYAWARRAAQGREIAVALAAHVGPLIDYSSEFIEWLLEQRPHFEDAGAPDETVARFCRGLAASNMIGYIPIREMRDAAARAAALYRALGLQRRLASSLRLQASWTGLLKEEGASGLLDQAQAMVKPDWGPEFGITILRSRYWIAMDANRADEAVALCGRSVQMAHQSGDWRVEVIERTNLGDLLYRSGRLAEALAVLDNLLADLRQRPVSDYEVVDLSGPRIWILAELGRLGDAIAAAREALPLMQRMPRYGMRGCAYFLARLGRAEEAAMVLGAYAARERAGLESPHPTEHRLQNECIGLVSNALGAAALAELQARGERLGYAEVTALLAECLRAPAIDSTGPQE